MLEAVDWSVVVVGRWNPSILTPAGIAKRLFKVPEDTPLEIQLAIDVMLPPRVTHENIRVTVGSQQLIIEPLRHTFAELERARDLARNAMAELPETPTTAAGLNIKYVYKEADGYLTRVLELMNCELDDKLSAEFGTTTKRSTVRSMVVGDGKLNLTVHENEQGHLLLHFNFEHASDDARKQAAWLRWPIEKCEEHVCKTLTTGLEFDKGMIPNE